MNIDRFKKIIKYSSENRDEINTKIEMFYSITQVKPQRDVLDMLQIVRASLLKQGFIVFEMPFADNEIGALCYKGDGLGYVIINSMLPAVNANFAIAHELYHVFFQSHEFRSKVEFAQEHYYDDEDEYSANLFAGMLLMPDVSFRDMHTKFKAESKNELDVIVQLMNYFKVPYMAVMIRCYELELLDTSTLPDELLSVSAETISEKFLELWLDKKLLAPTKNDDYPNIAFLISKMGYEFVEKGYLDERALTLAIKNIQHLYKKIQGETKG